MGVLNTGNVSEHIARKHLKWYGRCIISFVLRTPILPVITSY